MTTTAGPAEVARRLYSALAGGDRDTLDEILHPDFVGHLADGMPFGIGGEHRGAEAMRRSGWGGIAKHFAASAEAEQFALLEDGRLLVTGRYRGHGRRGGGAVDATFAHVVTVQDGRITALDQYTDTARWARGAPPYSAIEFEVAGGLATITLNRPKEGNAIDQVICEDLARAATRLAEDPGVRAVLLKANGPMFTAGGDIRVFTATPPERLPAQLRLMIDPYHFAIERLTALDAPLVAAVKGAAAGGGLGLVGMADIVVAAEDAVFTTGYGAIGMTSDGGNSWFLPRLIGMRRTQELYYTNRRLTAAEALDWGLVTSVVPADEVDAEGERIAAGIAQGPTRSFGAIRRLLRQSFDTGLRDQLADEEQTIVDACGTADTLEGVTAFAERRRPTYTGT
ncbi:enoyl-CoA hydratase-related protein [Pseudonocardia halophobica]|uniref:enoyl-CoA hydratase-related protein n=1 Tax=Pseudonocardia halophobica TaxID=29401 RepID=UPI0012DEDD0F|nr:enoyl-CoA hydratase-related protein [Pseudonocardia halophobica]